MHKPLADTTAALALLVAKLADDANNPGAADQARRIAGLLKSTVLTTADVQEIDAIGRLARMQAH